MAEWKPLILIVEDNEKMAELNARLLERQGYEVHTAYTAAGARSLFSDKAPDLFVLDVGLPDGDGYVLCEEFKRKTDAPILFLSGKKGTEDKIKGLNTGDYYLTKPYDRDEFIAIVRTLLRKVERMHEKITGAFTIEFGPLKLMLKENKALLNGRDAQLTLKEFAVLLFLAQNEDKEVSNEVIYRSVWGEDMSDTGVIRKHISQIKKKLDMDNIDEIAIWTEYGRGYTFTFDRRM